ncbi:MAG: hypothetical protein NZ809_04660 [Thermodesulfovibrio sp.]|nr:hypothetical protein [Thermodesulfovibrio sp.]
MGNRFTILYSSHRVEFLSCLKKYMDRSDIIILEDAPSESFLKMLNGDISVEEFLSDEIYEFPMFSFYFYKMLKHLKEQGKTILQIEPYMERLFKIHSLFSEGKSPQDVESISELNEVYQCEKKATKALIDFYEISLKNSFDEVVNSVKRFARLDAYRFRLRDELRAKAICKILPKDGNVLIEAGAIHQYLRKILLERLGKDVKTVFALEDTVKKLTGKRWIFPPGDILTLRYIFEAKENEELENLLSARALVYIMLIKKEEMLPTERKPIPHLLDEIEVVGLVNRLSYSDCEKLYPEIRFVSRLKALKTVRDYILRK